MTRAEKKPKTTYPKMHRNARGPENILDRIAAVKRAEAAALRDRAAALRSAAASASPARDFRAALAGPRVALIGEVKRRSPSAGDINAGLDPAGVARQYEAGGASCLSVLTDGDFFGGSLADLEDARAAVSLPVLRKDFVLEPVQVDEARAAGADAVLLIVRLLRDVRLRELREAAASHGMAALVEVHDARELDRALDAGADLIGINNRDLSTFVTSLDVSLSLLPRIPPAVVAVAESGIRTESDVRALADAGADAILVGESLVSSGDVVSSARSLSSVARVPRVRAGASR